MSRFAKAVLAIILLWVSGHCAGANEMPLLQFACGMIGGGLIGTLVAE